MLNIHDNQTAVVSREHAEMAAEAVIDAHRFGSPRRSLVDRILSQYEEVPALLPTAEAMAQQGGDIVTIAKALESGLSVKAFGQSIEDGLNLSLFSSALKCGFKARQFKGLVERNDIETVNSGLDHFVDYRNETPRRLSAIGRIAAVWGDELAATC